MGGVVPTAVISTGTPNSVVCDDAAVVINGKLLGGTSYSILSTVHTSGLYQYNLYYCSVLNDGDEVSVQVLPERGTGCSATGTTIRVNINATIPEWVQTICSGTRQALSEVYRLHRGHH